MAKITLNSRFEYAVTILMLVFSYFYITVGPMVCKDYNMSLDIHAMTFVKPVVQHWLGQKLENNTVHVI